jgi:cytosine/adenosine deaminase-related metal-dependent hydrolase
VSRRALLKAATLVAVLPLARRAEAQRGDTRANDAARERLQRTAGDARRRVLIRGGSILTMDPSVGDFVRGDVLIEGRRIAQVREDLTAASRGAIVIDAAESVVIPGFVDPHIHAWQGQLAGVIPNSNGVADDREHNYFTVMHQTLGPQYRPEDIYIGNLLTALTCIDAGITCFCDNSHNSRSAAHADAAITALRDASPPGKDADVVIVRSNPTRMQSLNNAIGAVVQSGGVGSVDAVFIAGQLKKWRGALVGPDLAQVRRQADQSRRRLLVAARWPLTFSRTEALDIFLRGDNSWEDGVEIE